MINEVSPPGWGHTKAEKEKTKPEKPKSKIGGTADAMKKAQQRGDIPKNMNIFALMWSMKNKGDKPHYKPGVKDVLKKKYKGPEGQNEGKADEKPYPPTRLFKNVPNSVVKKANKEADKVKREQEKAVLGEPPKSGPSGASMHSKDNVYEDEKVDMVSLVAQAIQMKEFGLPPATVADKDLGDKINKAHEKEQKRRAGIDAKNIKVHGKLPYKKEEVEIDEDDAVSPDAMQRYLRLMNKLDKKKEPPKKATKKKTPPHPDPALTKQRRGEEVEVDERTLPRGEPLTKKKDKPEPGKIYALTGRGDQPSIARGDNWKASEVTKKRKEQDAKKEGWGAVSKAADELAAKSKAREDKARNKKVSAWAKGRREGVENESRSLDPGMAKHWQKSNKKKSDAQELELANAKKADKKQADEGVRDIARKVVHKGVDKAVGVAVKVAKKHGGLSNKDIRGGAKQMKTDPGGALGQVGAPKNRLTKAIAQKVAKSKTVQKALKKHTANEVTHFGDILRQAIAEAKKVDAIKEIDKIVKTKTMGKLHGQKVDLFTASAIQQVYKAINHKNKEKMNSVMSKDVHGLLKMADFSMSKMKRR